MERYHIIKSVLGGSDVYDDSGNRVGYSLPSIIGKGEDFFDMDGNPVGQSFESVLGGEYFTGEEAHGFIDDEICMGNNMYLHGNPCESEESAEVSFDNTDSLTNMDDC